MIGIVILNYNNYQDTINCIASLQINCPDENLKIVVIDNGSTNDSIEQISTYFRHKNLPYNYLSNYTDDEKYDEKFILINAKKNLGYARGNNIGINFLIKHNVEAILILNNDIILIENIIETLINDIKKNPDIGLISPLLLKDENQIDYNCCRNSPSTSIFLLESINIPDLKFINNYIQSKLLVLNNNKNLLEKKIIYCDIISGSCILAKTEVWQKLGGFDENTFLYYEENILFEKLKLHNLKSAINPKIKAIHIGARSTKKVHNTEILNIAKKSLLYYLKEYRKSSPITFQLIRLLKSFRIFLISVNNLRRKVFFNGNS